MSLDRRAFLGLALSAAPLANAAAPPRPIAPGRLGIVLYSYAIRSRVERERGFSDPLRFVEFCRQRGAGGVQLPLGTRDASYIKKLRAAVERAEMYLEGSIRVPKDRADCDRFESEVRTVRQAGVSVVRTVLLSGRRYETFSKLDDYRAFEKQGLRSLELAAPVLARHGVTLAVENHKDHRSGELVALMRRLSSERIGVCVDTGNNIALLEEPLETVRALAPWAVTCHLKDMAVEEMTDGFLLSEVPLGEGFLDLKGIVAILRKAKSEIRFGLEMITRDPLRIPCLAEGYWATFPDVPGRDLARTLALVRKHARPLPRISKLPIAAQQQIEEQNVRRSLAYARKHLLG